MSEKCPHPGCVDGSIKITKEDIDSYMDCPVCNDGKLAQLRADRDALRVLCEELCGAIDTALVFMDGGTDEDDRAMIAGWEQALTRARALLAGQGEAPKRGVLRFKFYDGTQGYYLVDEKGQDTEYAFDRRFIDKNHCIKAAQSLGLDAEFVEDGDEGHTNL